MGIKSFAFGNASTEYEQTPKGNLITANGDAVFAGGTQNDLVEFAPHGNLIATYQLDAGPPGAAFGIARVARLGPIRRRG